MCKKSLCKIINGAVRVPKEIQIPDGEMVLIKGGYDKFSLTDKDSYGEFCESVTARISADEETSRAKKRMIKIMLMDVVILTVKGGKFRLPEYYKYLAKETELEAYVSGNYIKFEKRDTEDEI